MIKYKSIVKDGEKDKTDTFLEIINEEPEQIEIVIETHTESYNEAIINKEPEQIEIVSETPTESYKEAIINEKPEQIEIVIETPTESYDETIIDNCNRILEENFEDGYILENYMHQMRFISYYEDTFGSSVGKEADELDKMLKSIGNVIEDRVFAAKNGEEAMLLDDISLEINNLLDEGASCVYMECVYEKYSSRLNTELNIYNSDTLTNVLRSRNKINAKYRFKSDRIANTTDDCQLDVKKILQNSHVSISYDEIKEILWSQ